MSNENSPSNLISMPAMRLTIADRQRLKAHARRSGLTPRRLFARINVDAMPEGLTADIVKAWMTGAVREAPISWFTALIAIWERMPDQDQQVLDPHHRKAMSVRKDRARVPLTGEMRSFLLSEIRRADASYVVLLADAPEGLNERLVRSWEIGQQASVDAELWEFVIAKLASMRG